MKSVAGGELLNGMIVSDSPPYCADSRSVAVWHIEPVVLEVVLQVDMEVDMARRDSGQTQFELDPTVEVACSEWLMNRVAVWKF